MSHHLRVARIEPLGIESEGLTQVEAGEHFGVSQPRISNLVRGRIEEFTIDSLVNMLSHAGIRTDVVVSPGR